MDFSITIGKAAGEVSTAVRTVMDGIQFLGAGVLSQVMSVPRTVRGTGG